VEVNVLLNEGGNEVVTMVVSCLVAELQVDARSSGGVLKLGGVQEFLEVVRGTSVDQGGTNDLFGGKYLLTISGSSELFSDDGRARVLFKLRLLSAKEFLQSVNAESRLRGVSNGSESRAGDPFLGFQGHHKGAISSHGVSHDRHGVGINREEVSDESRQFMLNVVVHSEVHFPICLSGIAVVTSTISVLPVSVFVSIIKVESTGRGVREDHGDAVLLGVLGESRLLDSVILVAGKSRQVVQLRVGLGVALLAYLVFRKVNVELHLASEHFTFMLDSLQDSTVELSRGNDFSNNSFLCGLFSNLEDTTEAVTTVKSVNEFLNFLKSSEVVSNEFVNGELTQHDFVDELGDILAGFPSTEGGTLPASSGDKLEWAR